MKKNKKVSKIAQGINESVIGEFFRGIFWGIIIIGAFFLIIFLLGLHQNWRFQKDNCGGQPCPIASTDNCIYGRLDCTVLDTDTSSYGSSAEKYLCGYQEANAWLQYEENLNQLNLSMICN